MAWDDAKKAKAIEMYTDAQPTPENSMEIVKEIADALDESPNGVRMILSKAEVYVKKDATKTTTKKEAAAGTRVNKESAIATLKSAIEAAGHEVDEDIVGKLTGKAAVYFSTILGK